MVIDRLVKYMEFKGLNDHKVTLECDLSTGLIGKARKGRGDLGKKSIEKILKKYGDLNRIWLLTGEGEMLKRSESVVQVGESNFNNISNSTIDNRHYYSDSPDVLRAELDKLDRLLAEKENRIAEKDKQIAEKDKQIAEKDKQIAALIAAIGK